jgi:hypothetical protein
MVRESKRQSSGRAVQLSPAQLLQTMLLHALCVRCLTPDAAHHVNLVPIGRRRRKLLMEVQERGSRGTVPLKMRRSRGAISDVRRILDFGDWAQRPRERTPERPRPGRTTCWRKRSPTRIRSLGQRSLSGIPTLIVIPRSMSTRWHADYPARTTLPNGRSSTR